MAFLFTQYMKIRAMKGRGEKWKWFNINNSSLPPHVVCVDQIRRKLLKNWKKKSTLHSEFYVRRGVLRDGRNGARGKRRGKCAIKRTRVFQKRERTTVGEWEKYWKREREWDRKNTVRRLLRADSEGPK